MLITRLDRRYWIVLGACLTQFTIVGLLFSYGLFFKALEEEYGWSRTLLSSCSSLAFFMMGVLASFGGHLSDRYGPRLVLAVAGVFCGLGYALLAHVTAAWQLFVVFGVFIAIGMATHDVATLSTVARQFQRRRGLMTGVVKVGTALGQITIPLLAAFLMALYDWRLTLTILGYGAVVVLVCGAALMKSPAASGEAGGGVSEPGIHLKDVRRNRIFWMICAIQFSHFTTLTTVPLHIVVHGMDLGMTSTLAASLLSVMGAASIAGRLTVGGFADRIGGKRALILCFVPLITGLLSFLFIGTPSLLFGAAAIYGFAHGGLFTVISPTIAEYFGLKSLGAIFGVVVFFGTIGGAIGPIMAGAIFDLTNSYFYAFLTLAGLAALGLILVLRLPASNPGLIPNAAAREND